MSPAETVPAWDDRPSRLRRALTIRRIWRSERRPHEAKSRASFLAHNKALALRLVLDLRTNP